MTHGLTGSLQFFNVRPLFGGVNDFCALQTGNAAPPQVDTAPGVFIPGRHAMPSRIG
jgi:hypothetical protein